MKVIIEFGRLRFRVDIDLLDKRVFVRGHYRVTRGKPVYVKLYYRRR